MNTLNFICERFNATLQNYGMSKRVSVAKSLDIIRDVSTAKIADAVQVSHNLTTVRQTPEQKRFLSHHPKHLDKYNVIQESANVFSVQETKKDGKIQTHEVSLFSPSHSVLSCQVKVSFI